MPQICTTCFTGPKINDSEFCHCLFVRNLSNKLLQTVNLNCVIPKRLLNLFDNRRRASQSVEANIHALLRERKTSGFLGSLRICKGGVDFLPSFLWVGRLKLAKSCILNLKLSCVSKIIYVLVEMEYLASMGERVRK